MPGLHAWFTCRVAPEAGVCRIPSRRFWGRAHQSGRPDGHLWGRSSPSQASPGRHAPPDRLGAPASGRRRVDIKKARPTRAGLPFGPYAEASLGVLLAAAKGVLHGILDAAHGVLHLAGDLVALAFAFELGVAQRLAGRLLNAALQVLRRTLDPVFVSHGSFL